MAVENLLQDACLRGKVSFFPLQSIASLFFCLELKVSREKLSPVSFAVTVTFSLLSPPLNLPDFPLPHLLSAIWGQKLHREYSSTSNVFWSLTKANCLLLLPRLEIPSGMKSHPARALSEWGTANFLFQHKATWEQGASSFCSRVCAGLFHFSAFSQRNPDYVPGESQALQMNS